MSRLRTRAVQAVDPPGTARQIRSGSGRTWRVYFMWFLLISALGSAWSLATPIGGSPDEPTHTLRAVSVVRGQWLGPTAPGTGGVSTLVRVPDTYAQLNSQPNCFAFRHDQAANCAPPLTYSPKTVTIVSSAGRYPPLYYLLVGWPSLLTSRPVGFYLMRIASVLVSAGFLAMAVTIARRWSRSNLLVPGIAVAMTPMAIFLSSTVNPNGLEVASAIAVWTAAIVLVGEHAEQPPKALVALLALATMVLVSIRGASPLWPVLILVVLFPLIWRRVPLRVLRSRWVIGWVIAIVVTGALDTAWILGAHALRLQPGAPVPAKFNSTAGILRLTSGLTNMLVHGAIGDFGWLDTPAPWLTTTVWYVVPGALVLVSVMWSSARRNASLLLACAFSFLFPVILQTVEAHRDGLFSQGRYYLPLYVGVPLVAAGLTTGGARFDTANRRACAAIGIALGAGQFAAFAWVLRRYVVGFNGPLLRGLGPAHTWRPPLPWQVLDICALCLCVLMAFGVSRVRRSQKLGRHSPTARTDHAEPDVGLDSGGEAEDPRPPVRTPLDGPSRVY